MFSQTSSFNSCNLPMSTQWSPKDSMVYPSTIIPKHALFFMKIDKMAIEALRRTRFEFKRHLLLEVKSKPNTSVLNS